MLFHYLASDIAVTIGSGDYSVHIVAGIDGTGRLFIVNAWRGQCSVEDTAFKHIELLREYPVIESLIENDPLSSAYAQTLARISREMRCPVPWKIMSIAGKDKEVRASPLRSLFQRGRVFLVLGEWNKWLTRQLLMFPHAVGSGVDDGIDALGLLGRRFNMMGRPSVEDIGTTREKPTGSFYNASFNELFEANECGNGGWRIRI